MSSRQLSQKTGEWWCLAICILIALFGLSVRSLRGANDPNVPNAPNAPNNTEPRGQLEGIYEPSGVAQTSSGALIVIEDEPLRPFWLLRPSPDGRAFDAEPLRPKTPLDVLAGSLNDLEAITAGDGGFVYAITSHSRQRDGKRDETREKLVRFKVKGDRMEAVSVRGDLRKELIKAFPDLEDAADKKKGKTRSRLNIEGLAFDPLRKGLWIGFRAPVIDDDAVLISLANPRAAFERDEPLRFADAPVLLDLDGGGIRDISYSPRLGGYLVLSQLDADKDKRFKLWFWNGLMRSPPRRIRIDGVESIDRAEGVVSLTYNNEEKVLVVHDDGDQRRGRGASFLLLDYTDLRIEGDES